MQVGVIMGGISSEKEVSLLSGEAIIENLDKKKYDVLPIKINTQYELIDAVRCLEFAFIALHGQFGEDGTVQAILKSMGVPFTGSDVLSSAMCMNKDLTKRIFISQGINTPKWHMIRHRENIQYENLEKMSYPLVVKPNNGGSSIGINIVKNRQQLQDAILEAFKYDNEVMVEEYIKGEEITSCILDGNTLPILSIKPKEDNWFDYKSKYEDGGAEKIVVDLPKSFKDEINNIGEKCWKNFNLKDYAMIDMIIRDNKIYVLEINTLPGMTKNSLFPKSAIAAGMNFSELLDKIIQCSLKK